MSKVKGFSKIKLELMEPQNQVRVETLLLAFFLQGFWSFSYIYGVGAHYPTPQYGSTAQHRYHSGYKWFFLVEVVFMLASGILCMLR